MKYLKVFETDTDQQNYINGEFDRPNITVVRNKKQTINYVPKMINDEGNSGNLITFTINGTEYQAEDGMTFYDWALSEYYDNSCNLFLIVGGNDKLKDTIINTNISPDESFTIFYGAGLPIIPYICTDTIIQPISYTLNYGAFG